MNLSNFEKLKNLSMEEMAEFLSDQMALEGTVYDQWWWILFVIIVQM